MTFEINTKVSALIITSYPHALPFRFSGATFKPLQLNTVLILLGVAELPRATVNFLCSAQFLLFSLLT